MAARRGNRSGLRKRLALHDLDEHDLLRLRLSELHFEPEETPVWPDVLKLFGDLDRRGISFRPHVWFSTEWFSPDGVPGIALPFFLAHPRLRSLERRMTGEAEGASRYWRRRILRHEAGHALDTAFGLRRRADWRKVFGHASKRYPQNYSVRPASRRFVLHLGHWYAQSHPTEDFAETFAVWLQPRSRWRKDYAGWPALEKLEFVDSLMAAVATQNPKRHSQATIAPLSQNSRSLAEHYRRKAADDGRTERRYDDWIRQVFAPRSDRPGAIPAARLLRHLASKQRSRLLRSQHGGPYLVDHVIDTVQRRARSLDLVQKEPKRETERMVSQLHERIIADVLRRNREQYVL